VPFTTPKTKLFAIVGWALGHSGVVGSDLMGPTALFSLGLRQNLRFENQPANDPWRPVRVIRHALACFERSLHAKCHGLGQIADFYTFDFFFWHCGLFLSVVVVLGGRAFIKRDPAFKSLYGFS
jgi:hypothetical protein